MKDLIERLTELANSNRIWRDTALEAIAALSPVLPEDVQKILVDIRSARDNETDPTVSAFYGMAHNLMVHDLIERLARENRYLADDRAVLDALMKHRQSRIEELTECNTELMQQIKWQEAAELDSAKKRIEELENDAGAAAWILEWMVAEKYRKPDVPALIAKARKNYCKTLDQISEYEKALEHFAGLSSPSHEGVAHYAQKALERIRG